MKNKIKAVFKKYSQVIQIAIQVVSIFVCSFGIAYTILDYKFEGWKSDFIMDFEPNDRPIHLIECLAEFDGRLMPTSKCYAPLKEHCGTTVVEVEKQCTVMDCVKSPKVDLALICRKEYDRGYNKCVELYDIESKMIPTCKPRPSGGIMR